MYNQSLNPSDSSFFKVEKISCFVSSGTQMSHSVSTIVLGMINTAKCSDPMEGNEKFRNFTWEWIVIVGSPSLSAGNMFQDSHGMPETMDSTKPYIYYVLSYTYRPDKV